MKKIACVPLLVLGVLLLAPMVAQASANLLPPTVTASTAKANKAALKRQKKELKKAQKAQAKTVQNWRKLHHVPQH